MTSAKKNPSRLQTLELQGYKTFASKTKFEFAPTITAIVGPNGSGKSNIADAIRWVLGEQAYSLLRGKKTEDMIFSGSENRARSGMAAATIRFDNSQGWLPIDFNEVSIGRRAHRDGQNEYLINDQKVRLRDVSELLSESGLAERTYTIIGQGLVDTALSLRAEERRELFEEAAGIGLYRSRREEAVRRLDSTKRNLERVQDILAELRPRLRSLERQAQRARDYEQVKEDLKSSLRLWYGFHWNRMQAIVSQATQSAQEQAQERRNLHQEQDSVDKDLVATRKRIEELREQLQESTKEAGDLYARRQDLGRQEAVLGERVNWLVEQQSMIQAEHESLQAELTTAEKAAQVAKDELDDQAETVHQLEQQAGEAGIEGGLALRDRRQRDAEISRLRKSLEDLAGRQAAWNTRESQLNERRHELQENLEAATQAVQQAQAEQARLQKAYEEANAAFVTADERLATILKSKRDLQNDEQALASKIEEREKQQKQLQRQVDRLQSRLAALRELTEGPQAGSQALLQAAERGELAGVAGRLLSKMQVPRDYRRAISTALGELIGALAVTTRHELKQALDFLSERSGQSRTVLVSLETGAEQQVLPAPTGRGVIGNAAELVSANQELAPVINQLLGRTWLVENRNVALKLRSEIPDEIQLVTLAGELFQPSGVVIVGPPSFGPDRQEREKIEADLAELEEKLEAVSVELTVEIDGLATVRGRLEAIQSEFNQAEQEAESLKSARQAAEIELRQAEAQHENRQQRQQELEVAADRVRDRWQTLLSEGEAFDEQRARLERSLARIERQTESSDEDGADELELEWQRARETLKEAEARWRDRKQRVSQLREEAETWRDRLEANAEERQAKEAELAQVKQEAGRVEASLNSRQQQLTPIEDELKQAETRRAELEKAESRLRFQLQAVENRHSQAQVELARREEELLGLQRRIEDDFGLVAYEYDESTTGQEPLPLDGLVERLPNVDELPEGIETQVKRLRAQLRRMGSINPEAQEEYLHVRDRMEFMTSQVDDLREAESQMQEVIAELDVIMAREFRTTFEQVASAFKETFQQLFGGGSARLILTDPDDPNESGIEIEARLPGKREQGLAVLSGGERSLTASALIFALLKVSPTPFAVMDEVDAMLDESNVMRFCELLQELSENTQFIVITHNRETVQVAEAVYGITMESDSTSRIISLDLDEAAREVAAA